MNKLHTQLMCFKIRTGGATAAAQGGGREALHVRKEDEMGRIMGNGAVGGRGRKGCRDLAKEKRVPGKCVGALTEGAAACGV